MKKTIYTSGRGAQFEILPLSPYQMQSYRLSFQEQYEAEHPRPEQPMYRTETAGGGYEDLPHDKDSVATDEERAALEAYLGYETAMDNHLNQRMLDVMIVECVNVDPSKDKSWLSRKKFFGVKLPEDETELKLLYVRDYMVFNSEDGGDFNNLPLAITRLSGISDQALNAGRATFRRSLRQRRRDTAGALADSTDATVVDGEPLPGDADGEIMGIDAEPVG